MPNVEEGHGRDGEFALNENLDKEYRAHRAGRKPRCKQEGYRSHSMPSIAIPSETYMRWLRQE